MNAPDPFSRFSVLLATLLVCLRFTLVHAVAGAEFLTWAKTPPMGWNSWDCFATTVTEAQTKAQTDVMSEKLKAHGWEYIVVDIQWYEPNARSYNYRRNAELVMDEFGRLLPATNRFPSAANGVGLKALADYVHGKGLKFGIHLMRGIPRQAVRENTPVMGTSLRARDIANTNSICTWNPDMFGVDMSKPGAQDYYDSVFKLIASWDVDYVKVDDISRPYHNNEKEIEAIRRAIDRTGRPMVLSLSPGETALSAGDHVIKHANLWRISDDFWDNWRALHEQFERLRKWTPYRATGHWPDADMLPFGVLDMGRRSTRFTKDEQYTVMTLWCIARSPLMHGGDMTKMDDFTLSLLTNDEVLAVNQHSGNNRELFHRGDLVAWVADVPDCGDKYLALFNAPAPKRRGEATNAEPAQHVPVKLHELGFHGRARIRDLWQGTVLGEFSEEFAPEIPAHGAGLYRVSAVPGNAAVRRDRALVAIARDTSGVYLGWRLLGTDPAGIAFNAYRSTDGSAPKRLNSEPIKTSTNFEDKSADLARRNEWTVKPVVDGKELAASDPAFLAAGSRPQAYRAIKLQGDYPFSKLGIADLDGDGKLDFVIKQPQQVSDPGVWKQSAETFKIEAYRNDGTFMWRYDLGWNIEQGVWWSPMIVADFDGDGKAEVAVKTAPKEPVFRNDQGRILDGPEYCSVLDGMTGREIARVDWPARGNIADWGDNKGNRASRHLMGFAKLDGKRTSLLAMRGTYTKMLVDSYNLIDGRLETVWRWNGDDETPKVRGQGMHGMHAVDVDGDGREEIVLGAAVIDDNGKILWNLGMGHPDACYVTDVDPSRPGLEIMYGFETAQEKNGFCLVEAKTGKVIWGCDHMTTHIHSQGLLADIDPDNPGLEFYDGEKFLPDRWIYSARDGKLLGRDDLGSLAPNPVYWDDSYIKPHLEGNELKHFHGATFGRIEGKVIAIGDILGDWREEILTSVPGEIRIYTTTIPATRRHVWLMDDPIYRNDVTVASMGYLYPPQLTIPLTAESNP